MILYMSVVLYAPSIALKTVTGLSIVSSITLVGLVCVFYSTIGGIKAVIITDVFQVNILSIFMSLTYFEYNIELKQYY